MDKAEFKKQWKKFLIDIGKNERDIALLANTSPSNINRKVNDYTFKYSELSEIVEKYGYTISIRRKE